MCIASADRYTEYKYFCNFTHALRRKFLYSLK